ncbi:putative cytitidyltransferase [Escherichia phage ph0011]|nr:putative cytitidyltransferase [Escherichia phage ph0011]
MKETCILSFMRCNPVHNGHGLVFEKAKTLQEQYNADLKIYLSTSTDNIKNQLPPELKMYYTEGFYPSVQENIYTEDNLFDIMRELDGKYLDVFFICGSDRIESFQKTLDSYNGKLYNFCNIKAIQAGIDRQSSQYSSTQMRNFAKNEDFDNFREFLPGNDEDLKIQLFEDVIKYMRK